MVFGISWNKWAQHSTPTASSQAIGPLGDYLGLGKGVIAESLDLDRSTLGCFDFEASKVMQRMGIGLRGVTSWRTEHKFRPNHITF